MVDTADSDDDALERLAAELEAGDGVVAPTADPALACRASAAGSGRSMARSTSALRSVQISTPSSVSRPAAGSPATSSGAPTVAVVNSAGADAELKDELRRMMRKIQELEQRLQHQSPVPAASVAVASPAGGHRPAPAATRPDVSSSSRLPMPTAAVVPAATRTDRRIQETKEDLFRPASSEAASSSSASSLKRNAKKELFGDDSGSEEESDYRAKSDLSAAGKEINKLIQTNGGVSSGVSTGSTARLRNSWTKPKSAATPSAASSGADRSAAMETISSIRVINCTVSSLGLKSLIGDRAVAKLSSLSAHKNPAGEWVTVGVICRKTETKQTKDGKKFIIFKLTDLDDIDKEVTLFLFGGVYTVHWKLPVGHVIGLMAPNFLKNEDASGTCITINDPDQLLKIGTSKDLAFCSSLTKAGTKCSNYINGSKSDKCSMHVHQAYKSMAHKRPDLTTSYTGSEPKAFQSKGSLREKILTKSDVVYYGGQSYTSASLARRKDKVTLQSLAQRQSSMGSRVTSLTLHDILPEDVKLLKEVHDAKASAAAAAAAAATAAADDSSRKRALEDFIMVPSAGSAQFLAHLKKMHDGSPGTIAAAGKAGATVITASEFLRESTRKIRDQLSTAAKRAGCIGSSRGVIGDAAATKATPPLPASKVTLGTGTVHPLLNGAMQPVLARGVAPGDDICLDLPLLAVAQKRPMCDPKLKAISVVNASGGIKPVDPNATRKQLSDKVKDSIRRQVLAEHGKNAAEATTDGCTSSRACAGDEGCEGASLAKKAKEMIFSDEFTALLKARSSHSAAIAQVEDEKLGQYFDHGEKKEKYEEQMQSTHKIRGVVFSCMQCKYTDWKLADRCKQEGHQFKRIETWKRFFKCTACGHRCVTHLKLPVKPCAKCSGTSYAKAGMMRERKAAALDSEKLALRGDEEEHLSSLAYYQPTL